MGVRFFVGIIEVGRDFPGRRSNFAEAGFFLFCVYLHAVNSEGGFWLSEAKQPSEKSPESVGSSSLKGEADSWDELKLQGDIDGSRKKKNKFSSCAECVKEKNRKSGRKTYEAR